MPDAITTEESYLIGPGAYPATPVPSKIETETSRWPQTRVQFEAPYVQVLGLTAASLTTVRLVYEQRPQADFDTLRNYWNSIGGMAGTFPFTNPVSNEMKRMRFARPILAWAVRAGPRFYTLTVDLEEAP